MRSWPLMLRIGLGLFVVGSGPLALFALVYSLGLIRDPNPNPVGLGLLFFFTIWPAAICVIIGLVQAAFRKPDRSA